MSLPKRIQGLVKLSPWALVVLSGLLVAGPATAAPLAAGAPETAGQQGEAAATLVGARRGGGVGHGCVLPGPRCQRRGCRFLRPGADADTAHVLAGQLRWPGQRG